MKVHNWTRPAASAEAFTVEPKWWDGIRALPTLPSALFRFLGLVGDQNTPIEEMADFVCQDPALLARVLPVLPGGFTGASEDVASLRDAVSSLGRERLKALAHTTPLIRSFEPVASGSHAAILWERSVVSARAAQVAAGFLGLARPERYYVAGLLHDIGYLSVLQHRPILFANAVKRWSQRPAGLLEIETETFGATHSEIGAHVARQLNIPVWFHPAIEHHHNPTLDDDQVSAVAALASAFCNWQGIDLFPRQWISANAFSGGFRVREARTREMHDILRGLLPQLAEIERHRLLDTMLPVVKSVRASFRETFVDWFAAGSSWARPYPFTAASERIAAVA